MNQQTTTPARPAGIPRRSRTTSRKVLWTDRITTALITFGGLAVIAAVSLILVYLVVVVWPLFTGASVSKAASYSLLPAPVAGRLLFAEVDEYRDLGLYATREGHLVYFSARDGAPVLRTDLSAGAGPRVITAFSRAVHGGRTAIAYDDGSVRLATIGFSSAFLPASEASETMRALPIGSAMVDAGGVVERSESNELRRVTPLVEFAPSITVGRADDPPVLLDYRASGDAERLAVLSASGELLVNEVIRQENMMTGEVTAEVASTSVGYPAALRRHGTASHLLLTSKGDQLYLGWKDGTLARFDLRDPSSPALVEVKDLTPAGVELRALSFMVGEQSIVAGDSAGVTRAWFRVPRENVNDGFELVAAHEFEAAGAGIGSLSVSPRDKTFATGSAKGVVALLHLTSQQFLGEARVDPPAAVAAVHLTAKGDGLFAVGADGRATLWRVSNPHPETTVASIFSRVWYEGYQEPSFTWQSSSGTDDFEPKLSLVPLVFGTLKATLYSLLFALPIALAAAIYTSEFLDVKYRTPLKSTVELMASLPSVVLGFIAALVLAPIIENWVLAVLVAFAVIPVLALGVGYAWQLLSPRIAVPVARRWQFAILIAVVGCAIWTAPTVGGALEVLLFQGDFKGWLDGRSGSGLSGTAIAIWPLVFVAILVAERRILADALARRQRGLGVLVVAALDAVKYLVVIALSIAGAWTIAAAATALGFDPRGVFFGTYVQRNALIVGFVTGFAVIPIIYTIAEDALSAVPQSLRSASLGCGATRWQTATRVVLPVALSGIFSAAMIGLGRAVGETMIVLMAAGNTPLMDFNIFNGLRTLSANIAVELPEAVKDGTLYRMLFLAALTLFVLTFVVNTIAELIRQRFRKRAFQL
ncbi:MAG: ABC transporter permease subunit [Thermoanaerobaculia bacterium]